jgi:hypothetical protein
VRLRPLLVFKQTALDFAVAVTIRAPTPIPIAEAKARFVENWEKCRGPNCPGD